MLRMSARQIRAANTVKRAWKVFKLQLLQKKLREEQQVRRDRRCGTVTGLRCWHMYLEYG